MKHKQFVDRASSVVLFILWSLPSMWVGQMLIGYFCGPTFKNWFPPAGLSSNYAEQLTFFSWLADRLWHLSLPVFCLTYSGFAYLTKQVRAGMLDSLGADYVRTARAKGLRNSAVIFKHAFGNSMIVVMAVATIAGAVNLVGLLLGDIAYAAADPRISFESSR